MAPRLVVRVDGSREVGFGHAVRSLALVQAWLDQGGTASVASACLPDPVRQALLDEGVQVIGLPSAEAVTDSLIEQFEQTDWAIFDSYVVPAQVRELAKECCPHTGMIDDFGNSVRPVSLDLLIDQNLGASPEFYSSDKVGSLLLGSRFALLRRFFRSTASPQVRTSGRKLNILFLTGGSSHLAVADVFRGLAENLERQGHHVICVGSGLNTPHFDFTELPSIMTEADLAVSTAGSTCWELAWSGTPVVAIPIAENQKPIAERLDGLGAAVSLDPGAQGFQDQLKNTVAGLIATPGRRREMAEVGRHLVDGLGAERVVDVMLQVT
jgi:UDP-2,4-diacetamido-2,4,6-trideoxy-beta-L-altropyranose hydrolase